MLSEPGARFEAASALVAGCIGLDLERFSANVVDAVLESLPRPDAQHVFALDRVVAACSIGETMFLRQLEHFHLLRKLSHSLPAMAEGRPVRAWSAGCASGEEAYGLAAELGAAWGGCEVLGTDLNPTLIERACLGEYGRWSLRAVEHPASVAWLSIAGERVSVCESIRPHVRFSVHNLALDAFPGGWDVVFLRNVLMYFHEKAVVHVYARMAEAVLPGGLLFIADFDPEPCADGPWELVSDGDTRCFRRRAQGVLVASPPLVTEPPRASFGVQDDADSAHEDGSGDAPAQAAEAVAAAETLNQQGKWQQALALLSQAAQQAPLEMGIHRLSAMIASEAGCVSEALEAARRAMCLAPTDPLALYLYGICLQDAGEHRRAALHLRQAAEALAGASDATAIGDGLMVGELRRMIHVRTDDRCG